MTTRIGIATGAFFAAALLGAAAEAAEPRITLAVNEGAGADADSGETISRFTELAAFIEKTLGLRVTVVAARNRDRLRESLKSRSYQLLLARVSDLPAEAVRDSGYQVVATAREPNQAWFVVMQGSRIRSIADVTGRSVVAPERNSNTWRVAQAMLRDNGIDMGRQNVKTMRDQAAIGWAVQGAIFEVGVVDSVSGVARTWENSGGRVVAKSRDLPNTPFIASPELSAMQVAKLRAAVVGLDSSEAGRAILKAGGLTPFQEMPAKALLDFLAWLGDPGV